MPIQVSGGAQERLDMMHSFHESQKSSVLKRYRWFGL